MSKLGTWDILKSPIVTEKSVILKEDSTDEAGERKQGHGGEPARKPGMICGDVLGPLSSAPPIDT